MMETEHDVGGRRQKSSVVGRANRLRYFLGAILIATVAVLLWIRYGPLPKGFLDPIPHRSTSIVDRSGEALYETLSESEQRSHWIRPDEIPEAVEVATLAAEDHRFFQHAGVDPRAMARALVRDVIARGLVEGGSTITQQTVKQLLLARGEAGPRRSVRGKLREMILALRLEYRYDKREILALYLNLAPYGNQYVGIERASRGYFGISPANLTYAQAALLAGLPRKPSAFDPWVYRDAALARQRRVLNRMKDTGLINESDAQHAREERLSFRRPDRGWLAPHFVERVLEHPESARATEIETTLDLSLQREVLAIIGLHARSLERHGAYNLAIAVLDNQSGEWLAWVGSPDYFDMEHGGAIDAVTTPRQPGSALKPFTYALAFENGFTPATVLPDVEIDFPTAEDGVRYKPRNYDGIYRGPLRARLALAGSENVPAVWLLSEIGTRTLLSGLRASRFTTLDRDPDHYGLGLTLGNAEVRLDELVRAYAMFARGGEPVTSRMIRRIDGNRAPVRGESFPMRTVSERSAFWVTDILADSRAREYVFGSGGTLDFPFEVAVKTGTSQAYRDNWTIGYTRDLTVGVWVGNVDRAPLRNSTGMTGAAPIFHDVMLAAVARRNGASSFHEEERIALAPRELERVTICALSGAQPSRFCPILEKEWLERSAARELCSWHQGNGIAWPAEYRRWAKGRWKEPLGIESALPSFANPLSSASGRESHTGSLRIVNPGADSLYWIDPTLRPQFQTLTLRALVLGGPERDLTWLIDDVPIGNVHADAPLDWPLARGSHRITVLDPLGNQDTVRITVK